MDSPIPDLDAGEVSAIHSMMNSAGGRVFVRWLVGLEEQAIQYLKFEDSELEIRRVQGDLRIIQTILDMFETVSLHMKEQEPADG